MMNAGRKRLVWAAGLSVVLIMFWSWRSHVRAGHDADKAMFQAYLQGPLGDLLYGVSRSLPVLTAQAKPGPGAFATLKEADDSLLKSVRDLEALLKDKAHGPWTQSLGVVLGSHQAMAALISRWSSVLKSGKPALDAYLKDEEALRSHLSDQLDALRVEALKRQRWTRSDVLELNALLHSLRDPMEKE